MIVFENVGLFQIMAESAARKAQRSLNKRYLCYVVKYLYICWMPAAV